MTDETLRAYRARIDELDDQLIRLLAERFEITKAVGAHKAAMGLPPADPSREAEQTRRLRAIAGEVGMDPAFSEKVFRLIVDEVIHHHERIADAAAGTRSSGAAGARLSGDAVADTGQADGSWPRED